MGTINYGTSDYVTLGACIDSYLYKKDKHLMEELQKEATEYGTTVEEELQRYIDSDCEELYSQAEDILKDYDFEYFKVELEFGYYDGFYLKLEQYLPIFFADYEERKEANKEVPKLKEMLMRLVGIGMRSCYPGWCTGWADREESIKDIKEGVKKMRADIKEIMTYSRFERLKKEDKKAYYKTLGLAVPVCYQ